MTALKDKQQIYVVISQTGTVLSRILKLITGAEYNHASIALKEDLELMYSFGRLYPYNPFFGGFVTESVNFGTFKRFFNTKVIVLKLDIDADSYNTIHNQIESMLLTPKIFKYNYLGLCLAAFRIVFRRRNCFYCSEFVRDILQTAEIEGVESLSRITKPVDFISLPNSTCIYKGRLADYSLKTVDK